MCVREIFLLTENAHMPDVKKDLGECEARHVVLPYFLPLTFIQYACATVSESVGKKRDQCDRFAKRIYIKWKNFRILQRRYEILRLPYHATTASNLFGQCTQENSRVEENICSEKRPIKLLFSSSQASEGPLACFAACPGFLRASASQPLLLQNNFGQRGKNQCNIDALQKIATIFKVFSKKEKIM